MSRFVHRIKITSLIFENNLKEIDSNYDKYLLTYKFKYLKDNLDLIAVTEKYHNFNKNYMTKVLDLFNNREIPEFITLGTQVIDIMNRTLQLTKETNTIIRRIHINRRLSGGIERPIQKRNKI